MESIPSFNSYIEKSVIENWDLDALTDYKGVTLQYKDVARKIEKLHIMFENSGVEKATKSPSAAATAQIGPWHSLRLSHTERSPYQCSTNSRPTRYTTS